MQQQIDLNIQLVVLSGLSGSGKTVALHTLEDLGFYCVDNLPVELLSDFVETVSHDSHAQQKLAVGIDVRSGSADMQRLPEALSKLAPLGIRYQLIFLDSRDDVLFKRFSETRRKHPLGAAGVSLQDAIIMERLALRPLVAIADKVIDSSDLNVHQLRRIMVTELGMRNGQLSLLFESFAYKKGIPIDADFVFDARCLPNPHWDPGLRPLSGRDSAIGLFFQQQTDVVAYLTDVKQFLSQWIPRFATEQRSYLTIAVGCTGGRHRSVYLVEQLSAQLQHAQRDVFIFHRELQ